MKKQIPKTYKLNKMQTIANFHTLQSYNPLTDIGTVIFIDEGILGKNRINCHSDFKVGIESIQKLQGLYFFIKKKTKVLRLLCAKYPITR